MAMYEKKFIAHMLPFDRTANHETAFLNLLLDPWCLEPSNDLSFTIANYHIRRAQTATKQF